MGIALYGFQSIFSFVATELPSNSTDPGILKFCFLVISFLNFNNRHSQWACLDFGFLLIIGPGFSSLSSCGSRHLNRLLPYLHHYSQIYVPPATWNHNSDLTKRFHPLINSDWFGDRHRLKSCSKTALELSLGLS